MAIKTDLVKVCLAKEIVPPDGIYDGVWGGYVVKFRADGNDFVASTATGIRTPAAPCKVIVKGGKATAEVI